MIAAIGVLSLQSRPETTICFAYDCVRHCLDGCWGQGSCLQVRFCLGLQCTGHVDIFYVTATLDDPLVGDVCCPNHGWGQWPNCKLQRRCVAVPKWVPNLSSLLINNPFNPYMLHHR